MKIVKIKGGVGNQLFQYSYAKLLEKMTGDIVKIDMTSFDKLDDPIRCPRLLKMNVNISVATDSDIEKICMLRHKGNSQTNKYRIGIALERFVNRKYFFEKNRGYIDPESIQHFSYFDGYWQSWRYVENVWNEILPDLTPKIQLHPSTVKMIEEVKRNNSVFIGVRRGDYSAEISHYGSFGNAYYQKAMNKICSQIENPVFYIFSNDIPWVKKNIDFSNRTVIFREPEDVVDDFEDLLIMAACKHAIIINSTYHWWGAKINDNPEKIVIAPMKWFFDNKPIDIIPPHWVRIEE